MDKRQMKKRIFGVIAATLSENIEGKNMDISKELEREFESICKFKEPSRSVKHRWIMAKYEVSSILWGHSGLK